MKTKGVTRQQERNFDMAKLTTAIATDMVNRIEALQEQINAIFREASDYDGVNNVNEIQSAVKCRKELRDAEYMASAILEGFDAQDEKPA